MCAEGLIRCLCRCLRVSCVLSQSLDWEETGEDKPYGI